MPRIVSKTMLISEGAPIQREQRYQSLSGRQQYKFAYPNSDQSKIIKQDYLVLIKCYIPNRNKNFT
jgi:hypothetical protein